jgi:hypothetical protein
VSCADVDPNEMEGELGARNGSTDEEHDEGWEEEVRGLGWRRTRWGEGGVGRCGGSRRFEGGSGVGLQV